MKELNFFEINHVSGGTNDYTQLLNTAIDYIDPFQISQNQQAGAIAVGLVIASSASVVGTLSGLFALYAVSAAMHYYNDYSAGVTFTSGGLVFDCEKL